jgi:Heparinase II/III-like protein/Heparinase II/III N-terminus
MSVPEIAHRGRNAFRVQMDLVRFLLSQGRPDRSKIPEKYLTRDYLSQLPARRFFPAEMREDLCTLVQRNFPDWISAVADQADDICDRKISLLGHGEVGLDPVIDWAADPISRHIWPSRYWAGYDLVQDSKADPKVVHEINRHQHLITLGRAYFYTGNERYAVEALSQLGSWIEQNPEGVGINWHSSLEIAIRAQSWMWTLFLILPSEHLDDRRIERILLSLYAHFSHIHRYPSTYSSPNTHLIGEAAALYAGGLVFAELKPARQWRRFGEDVLIREAQRQVLDDGVYSELSSYYHCYALEFFLNALALARHNGTDFPESVRTRIESMVDVVMHVSRPDGSIPLLSDDDGGQASGLCRAGYRDIRHLLSTGAVLFGRPDFKWRANQICEETLFLFGRQGWDTFGRIQAHAPSQQSRLFANAGYFACRSGWKKDDDHLLFDCGGLGFLGGGHGHADALSFVLSSGNEELLIDPGTGIYNTAPQWRNYFRSTRAHNTVVVDGEDQAEPAGTFKWKNSFSSRLIRRFAFPEAEYIEAEHDAYARLHDPVIHRRRLLRVRPNCWIVADDFRGTGVHTFSSSFHFAPDTQILLGHRRQLCSTSIEALCGKRALRLAFFASNPVHTEVMRQMTDPIQGWVSKGYGNVSPAPVLCATVLDRAPSSSITILVSLDSNADEKDAPQLSEQLVEGGRGTACSLEYGGVKDLFVIPLNEQIIRVSEFEGRGEFFWIRYLKEEIHELFCVNASHASVGDRKLFDHPTQVSCTHMRFDRGRMTTTILEEPEAEAYVRH